MSDSDKNEKRIGRVKTQMNRKKLSKCLGMVALQDLVAMIWHIDRIQSDSNNGNAFFNGFPKEALTKDLSSPFFVFKWYLETLLSEFFLARPRRINAKGKNRFLKVDQWNTVPLLINLNREIEDAESLARMEKGDVFLELHRIAQRQFPWQRGLVSKRILFRYLSIYRSPETCKRFEETHGISFDDYVLAGFAFWTATQLAPQTVATSDFTRVGLSDTVRDKVVDLISDTPESAGAFYAGCRRKPHVAHLPSRLRTHPMLTFREGGYNNFSAPLNDLVLQRVTSGLAYDFFSFDDLKEGIASRFVNYANNYIIAGKNTFETRSEFSYKRNKNSVQSPDLFLFLDGELSVVIECKARRLSHAAQFATDPINDANQGFAEMAKGVVQLWRYCSDAALGMVQKHNMPSDKAALVLLTLDGWLDSSDITQKHVLKTASEFADKIGIASEYRHAVAFVSMEDMEHLIDKGNSNQIVAALKAQNTEEYAHWSVQTIFDDLFKDVKRTDSITTEMLHQVAPWFKKLSDQKSGI